MNLIIYICLIILVIFYIYFNTNIENFIENFNVYQSYQSFIPQSLNLFNYFIPQTNGYTNLPWWNTRLGNTNNMSYDIRGDPIIIPRTNFIWNNGTVFPIYNSSV